VKSKTTVLIGQLRAIFFRLMMRGAHDDFAALCTSDQVYEVKIAETSNTLLLASPIDVTSANKENGCVTLKVILEQVMTPMFDALFQGQFYSSFQTRTDEMCLQSQAHS
jgi:hypothetical protein